MVNTCRCKTVAQQIAKFKLRQYHLGTTLPNLMLTKVSCYVYTVKRIWWNPCLSTSIADSVGTAQFWMLLLIRKFTLHSAVASYIAKSCPQIPPPHKEKGLTRFKPQILVFADSACRVNLKLWIIMWITSCISTTMYNSYTNCTFLV